MHTVIIAPSIACLLFVIFVAHCCCRFMLITLETTGIDATILFGLNGIGDCTMYTEHIHMSVWCTGTPYTRLFFGKHRWRLDHQPTKKCQNKGAEYCNVDALVYVDENCYSLANIIFAIIAKSTTFPGSIVLSVCCVLCAHDTISDMIFKSICFQFIQLCSSRLFLFVRES